ncbi:styrene monooxygenase/indole monooxygenase family protein [Marinitenerispora sediminis]|nr:styrene monooxygenase/indole monooxygenase family protein [Marinitenerispora sediminis]
MSPKVLIVGAGQSGLYFGHQLLNQGVDVTLITGQTSTEIRNGRTSITQFSMPFTRALEEQAKLDLWQDSAPRFDRVNMSLRPDEGPAVQFYGSLGSSQFASRVGGHAVSVDRRVKMADWLEHFEDNGGRVVIHGITESDLAFFVGRGMYDLVVIAVGAGELGALFDPDPTRFSGAHDRVATQVMLHDVAWEDSTSADVYSINGGEVFFIPVLTDEGPATSITMLANPGALLDASGIRGRSAGAVLERMQEVLRQHLPDVYERFSGATVDDLVGGAKNGVNSAIQTQFRPGVRNPVGWMAGKPVLGMADVVVTSDPVSGQGWNNSTYCAQVYADAFAAHRGAYDEAFMAAAFERFWIERGQHSAVFSEMVDGFWGGALPEHFGELIGAVMTNQTVADRWIGGFDDPADYARWMFDPAAARAYLAEAGAIPPR